MGLRQDPNLIRCARRIRAARNEVTDGFDDPTALPQLLREDVTKHAPLFLAVIVLAGAQLVQHAAWHKRGRRQMRRRVSEILPRYCSMILENGHVFESLIALEILD